MSTYIYLGKPSAKVSQWIIDHSTPPTPTYHADTWYKYANDSNWRTISISNSIDGADEDVPTNQIPNVTNIVALEIGTDVTRIGDFAFEDCTNLTSIIIPNTVTQIKAYSFFNVGISNVIIPDTVTEMGFAAFANCQHLTTISIGNGITTLYQSIFSSSGLTSITIPNSVTSIGDMAFTDCGSLESVTIPSSVTSIGDYVFADCNGLTSVTFLGKTLSQVQAMSNYPWEISNTSIINVA